MTKPLIVVAGPTASGKSGLAIQLAQWLEGEIISADSMQLYRGMDIGTAKVTAAEQQGIAHHMLDVLEVTEEASVADYQHQTRRIIDQIRSRGRTPILAGGSGLYIRAVTDAIEFPPTDPQLRAQITAELQASGAAALRDELRRSDPESAAVIADVRRLVRALEVVRLTGRSFSSYMPQRRYEPAVEPVVQIGLRVDRALLHQRIAERVHQMRSQGLLEEVRTLEAAGLRESRTASRAIGYQQYLRVIDGAWSEDQAVEDIITATRRFARRQETWFRADPRIHWLEAPSPQLLENAVEAIGPADG
ncbi:tRNA (adenosine(37)-N6)-dimethylallyltransferase MiaA [Nesterenkonia sp.]|uniref:tRNA (adenosine(37)-N6)-dimethylallyltransferase MiaA n=1 Tax=Nesterenkonia sp. TaxID=704201 RepID=UPI0026097D02|nr:tRNA (adenosine(37)-N6)-dimethylallyltransferase MiaA [Nesterenkonia sp.]